MSTSTAPYEAPTLKAVGTVKDLTLGEGIRGSDDSFVFHIGRHTITIPYGHS